MKIEKIQSQLSRRRSDNIEDSKIIIEGGAVTIEKIQSQLSRRHSDNREDSKLIIQGAL